MPPPPFIHLPLTHCNSCFLHAQGVATYCKDSATPFAAEEGLTGLLTNHEGAVGCYGHQAAEFCSEELQLLDNEGRAVVTQHRVKWDLYVLCFILKDPVMIRALEHTVLCVCSWLWFSPHRCQDKEQTVTVINVYCPRADPEKPERKQFKLQFYKLLRCRAEAILKDGRWERV